MPGRTEQGAKSPILTPNLRTSPAGLRRRLKVSLMKSIRDKIHSYRMVKQATGLRSLIDVNITSMYSTILVCDSGTPASRVLSL